MIDLAVLLSGSGRTLDNFHARIEDGTPARLKQGPGTRFFDGRENVVMARVGGKRRFKVRDLAADEFSLRRLEFLNSINLVIQDRLADRVRLA